MGNNNNEALEAALQQVLNSLAGAYLSLGKDYPAYDMASRSAFIEAVSERAARRGEESLPDEAIAFLTGLDPADVTRLRREETPVPDTVTSAAVRLIELWQTDAADSEGRANPLPLDGPQSFRALLGRTGTSLEPADALAAFTAVGLARRENGMVYLNDDALPGPEDVEHARGLCAGAFPLLAAIGDPGRAERSFVETKTLGRVHDADVPRLRRIAETELKAAHARVADLLAAYETFDGDDPNDDDNGSGVTSGVYFVGGLSRA